MSSTEMVFGGMCRDCNREIEKTVEPKSHLISGEKILRVRCKECRTINTFRQVDVS